jgi:hypothetical protein
VTDSERDAAWKRIKVAAKKHTVEVSEHDWRELSEYLRCYPRSKAPSTTTFILSISPARGEKNRRRIIASNDSGMVVEAQQRRGLKRWNKSILSMNRGSDLSERRDKNPSDSSSNPKMINLKTVASEASPSQDL